MLITLLGGPGETHRGCIGCITSTAPTLFLGFALLDQQALLLLQKVLTRISVPLQPCLPSSSLFLCQLHLCNSSWVTSGRWKEESHFNASSVCIPEPSLSSLYFTREGREEGGRSASPRDESVKYFSNFHLQRLVSFNSPGWGVAGGGGDYALLLRLAI